MLFDELPVAFPWYDSVMKQNRFRENCTGTCAYKLVTPRTNLLPFQFRREAKAEILTTWEILYEDGSQAIDITRNIALVKARTADGYDSFYYDGSALAIEQKTNTTPSVQQLNLPAGFYYSKITAITESYYSELFYVPPDGFTPFETEKINYLKMEWWNDCDVKPIMYNLPESAPGVPGFKNTVYLDTFITASDPQIEQDGEQDGDNNLIPTFQKMTIPYKIHIMVPDYMKIALTAIQLHKNILITTSKGVRIGTVQNFEVKSQLEDSGCFSSLEITFEQPIAIVNHACCENMVLAPCDGTAPVLQTAMVSNGVMTLQGQIAANTWGNVYAAATNTSDFFLVAQGIPAEQINNGTAQLTSTQYGTFQWFKVVSLNFNCNYGQSPAIIRQ